MKLDYDGELGQIYAHLNDADITKLQEEKVIQQGNWLFLIDDIYKTPSPIFYREELWGICISSQLFDLFLDICKNPQGRACVERIGGMLTVELLKINSPENL